MGTWDLSNQNVAYALGFLWADGHLQKISENSYRIRFKILQDDWEDVKNRFSFIPWTSKTRYPKNRHPVVESCLNNIEIGKWLESLGYLKKSTISPKKVLILLPKENWSCFWLGYFDGDGSLSLNKYRRGHWSVTSSLYQDWSDWERLLGSLEIKYSIFRYSKNPRSKFSRIEIRNHGDILKISRYLYHAMVGLSRKFKIYKFLSEVPIKRSSKYRGVSRLKNGKWKSFVSRSGKKIHCGYFQTEEEAYAARQILQFQLPN